MVRYVLVIILTIIISNCTSLDKLDNNSIDPVIEMLLNSEMSLEYSRNSDEKDDLVFVDGLWKCGECSDLDNLIYKENYEFDLNDYQNNHNIQIGLSVEKMRCVTVKAQENAHVTIVDGNCSGEITLAFENTNNCEINVYG